MQAWDGGHRTKPIGFNTQGGITINAEEGWVTAELSDTVTATLP